MILIPIVTFAFMVGAMTSDLSKSKQTPSAWQAVVTVASAQ